MACATAYPVFTEENYQVNVDPFWKEATDLDTDDSSGLKVFNSCNECVVNGRIYSQLNDYPPFFKTTVDFDHEDPETGLNSWYDGEPTDLIHTCWARGE